MHVHDLPECQELSTGASYMGSHDDTINLAKKIYIVLNKFMI